MENCAAYSGHWCHGDYLRFFMDNPKFAKFLTGLGVQPILAQRYENGKWI